MIRISAKVNNVKVMELIRINKKHNYKDVSMQEQQKHSLLDKVKNTVISSCVGVMNPFLTNLLEKNYYVHLAKKISCKEDGSMISIKIDIDKIDYEQLAKKFLPEGLKAIPKNMTYMHEILDVLDEDTLKIVQGVLASVDNGKKEKIIEILFNNFDEAILKFVSNLMVQNGISAQISDLKLETLDK